ncbi:MAG TPA: hypothetical protein VED18_14445 [Candidatus Sulfotelmatobacter sp.]|nr:hypothetical protein [Candidatus Sulfotelmatobacter sp.]
MGSRRRWVARLAAACLMAAIPGCSQHYYEPGPPGPDNLRVHVQYQRFTGARDNHVFATAVVTRPDGASQPVDTLRIWLRTKDATDVAETVGRSEVSVESSRPIAPSDAPEAYACATHRGQTFCGGDPGAR